MNFKQVSFDIKGLDEKEGVIEAYANAYDFKDSDGDISAKGSFNKTVGDNFKRIRVLKDHNPTISLGVPIKLDASDPYGLLTVTQFNLKKEVSRDMFTDIQLMKDNGLNAELSIGYEVIARDEKNKAIIKEYKLYEYSFLTSWAANELATVNSIKSIENFYGILAIIEKSYNLNYSDTRLKQIETILKSLNQKPSLDDTLPIEPIELRKQLLTIFKNY
jgi:HK97 family phage prohead protease